MNWTNVTRPAIAFALASGALLNAEAGDGPPDTTLRAVPATRREMLDALDASKGATPRLPLPPLSDEERQRAAPGGWGIVNNGRMRRHYLPDGFVGGGFPARDEPGMTLGYPFQTKLFWIVSRSNHCTYCLGHQESKLADIGVPEQTVAALDGDWSSFDTAERAAFAFARAATVAPHEIGRDDIDALTVHFDDREIAEILYNVSSFNAMNRWTGALNIPQEAHRVYPKPGISDVTGVSLVAPLDPARTGSSGAPPARRPALESRPEVEAALEACRARSSRLTLAGIEETRAAAPDAWNGADPPQWARLLAIFPGVGGDRIRILRAVETQGTLDPMLRARVAWIAARHDRATYAIGHAMRRLQALGASADQIFALDRDDRGLESASARDALDFARKLTVDPARITDDDVDGLREHFSDREVAELIAVIAEAAFFDRITEAAGLPLE